VAAGKAVDRANNANTASNTISKTYDAIAPTATLASTTAFTTNVAQIPITVTFSEAVTGLTTGGFAASGCTVAAVGGSGTAWRLTVTPSADGVVTVQALTGAAIDVATNG